MTAETTATTSSKKEAAVQVVRMEDGRTQEFVGKRRMLKTSGKDPQGRLCTRIDFVNGATRTYVLPSALLEKAALHGFEQKLGDEVAGETNVDDMVAAIDALGERLSTATDSSAWNAQRQPGDSFSGSHVIIRALAEVSGKTKEEVQSWINKKLETMVANDKGEMVKPSRQQLYKALRASKMYGGRIAELEAEKASKEPTVNVDDLVA